ncbi:hypothetical protein K439DRAFT_1348061, partial [Ramaria rubella]
LQGLEYDSDETDFSEQDQDTIIICSNRLYCHQTCRLNFTTYNVQQSQDSINPRTSHCDIMVHSRDNPTNQGYHPFWYAHVLGIFHVNFKYMYGDSQWQPIPFLWIHWFGQSDTQRHPIHPSHYDRIGFVTEDDDMEPFGFLDPANIVPAYHLIPAFS